MQLLPNRAAIDVVHGGSVGVDGWKTLAIVVHTSDDIARTNGCLLSPGRQRLHNGQGPTDGFLGESQSPHPRWRK